MPKTGRSEASLPAESAENVIAESAAPIPEKVDGGEANGESGMDSAMPNATDRNLNEEEKEVKETEVEPPAVGLT